MNNQDDKWAGKTHAELEQELRDKRDCLVTLCGEIIALAERMGMDDRTFTKILREPLGNLVTCEFPDSGREHAATGGSGEMPKGRGCALWDSLGDEDCLVDAGTGKKVIDVDDDPFWKETFTSGEKDMLRKRYPIEGIFRFVAVTSGKGTMCIHAQEGILDLRDIKVGFKFYMKAIQGGSEHGD